MARRSRANTALNGKLELNATVAPARCAVPGSSGASLAREGEDALWQQVFMAQPERRRVFEPSSKRRKRAPAPWPPATG